MLVSYTTPNHSVPSAFDWVFNTQTSRRPESKHEVTDDGYILKLDVPGVTQDGLDVQVEDRTLKLSITRTDRPSERSSNYTWRLPRVADADNITAALGYGVLTLKIGKQSSATARKITVEEHTISA